MEPNCEISIARMHGADDGKVVRIDVQRGPELYARVEIPLEDFAAAVMGLGRVKAHYTTSRAVQPR